MCMRVLANAAGIGQVSLKVQCVWCGLRAGDTCLRLGGAILLKNMGGEGKRKGIFGPRAHLFHPFGNMAAPARFDNNPSSIEASGKDSPFGGRGGGNLVVDAQLPNEHVGNLGGCTACPVGSQFRPRRDTFCMATCRSVVKNVNAWWYAPNDRTVVVDIADT